MNEKLEKKGTPEDIKRKMTAIRVKHDGVDATYSELAKMILFYA